jgi:hypothetical protein
LVAARSSYLHCKKSTVCFGITGQLHAYKVVFKSDPHIATAITVGIFDVGSVL